MGKPVLNGKTFIGAAVIALALMAGCKKENTREVPTGPRPTPITVATASLQPLELREESVGYLESRTTPTVSAEVAGRVTRVAADNGSPVKAGDVLATLDDADLKLRVASIRAETERLEILTANQRKNNERAKSLLEQKAIPESQMDDSEAQLKALREQLVGIHAQLAAAERDMAKANITAPVSGKVQNRMVSVGDYMSVGKPAFTIGNEDKFQVHLPFPESAAHRIKTGQPVKLTVPTNPGQTYSGVVAEIKPAVTAGSRAIDVIIYKHNPGGWKAGASINGSVLVGTHRSAVVLPSLCVVLRPGGEVVYVIEGGKAKQRIVRTGVRQADIVEIIEGMKDGETVARDGAAFLTDGAAVKVREEKQP